jgi:hypothetical protein
LFSVWSSLNRVANSFGVRPARLVWGQGMIVVEPPGFEDPPRVRETAEEVFVEMA